MINKNFYAALQGYSDEALRRMGYTSNEIVDMRYTAKRYAKEARKGRR